MGCNLYSIPQPIPFLWAGSEAGISGWVMENGKKQGLRGGSFRFRCTQMWGLRDWIVGGEEFLPTFQLPASFPIPPFYVSTAHARSITMNPEITRATVPPNIPAICGGRTMRNA